MLLLLLILHMFLILFYELFVLAFTCFKLVQKTPEIIHELYSIVCVDDIKQALVHYNFSHCF